MSKTPKSSTIITTDTVTHVAHLAKLPLTQEQVQTFQTQLNAVLEYISTIQSTDTAHVEETVQVNNLKNVFREDRVESDRMFSQEEALANAHRTHNGYVVVDAILDQE